MLTDKKILIKLQQIEESYAGQRFAKVMEIPMEYWETRSHFRCEPGPGDGARWLPATAGLRFGDDGVTAWFRGDAQLPPECLGRPVFIRIRTEAETLLLVDGEERGVFDGFHPVVMMAARGRADHTYHLAFEAYAGHWKPGNAPRQYNPPPGPGCQRFDGVELLLERPDVTGFVFDLKVLRQTANILGEHSLRRGKIVRGLAEVYALVDAMPEETGEESWRPKLAEARRIMAPLLMAKNGSTAPYFGLIGHSHIDTAWLWTLEETWRKCARTFSSVLNLMEQYPEFRFIQSAPCHAEAMRREYPGIYERIRARVAEGRWEPNGAMWVEPDCNLPSGESLVRQLLVGQRATREMFDYTADTLWLPDVFGYSAALPQILRGAGVEFFGTNKLSWNDTTRFPYETFIWRGIDGTSVLACLNIIQHWPDPETLWNRWQDVQHKDIQDRALCGFGYGDGGGGPMNEMLETARRLGDLEGCPRTSYTSVSDFMRGLREAAPELPVWQGELYLELHRGTLTSIAKVKRGNRQAEFALREAEFLCTLAALHGSPYPAEELAEIWKDLLTRQFHDILPGSSIAPVNDEAVEALGRCVSRAREASGRAAASLAEPCSAPDSLLAVNTLSWERTGEFELRQVPEGMHVAEPGAVSQWVKDLDGCGKLIVAGKPLPAMGGALLRLAREGCRAPSPFRIAANEVETPFALARFDAAGRIISLVDKTAEREIVRPGGALNTFWLGEDIPVGWENWDIDRDQRLKMKPEMRLQSREIVADGPLQLRLRSRYSIGQGSVLTQDMVFHATTPRIDFETVAEWKEKRKLLKAGFELDILAETARHEIQFGHLERPTHTNLPQDWARFEVCAHKWTDLSEGGFGVALLNDCKYGVSVEGSEMRLSLLKSGLRPDTRGDEGRHYFTYALLPHAGGFSVEAVVRPAYELNITPFSIAAGAGTRVMSPLVTVDAPHVIVESVKWAEQGGGFVLRLYDAGKIGGKVRLALGVPVESVCETNLLEENGQPLDVAGGTVTFTMRPFEIKTLLCRVPGAARHP